MYLKYFNTHSSQFRYTRRTFARTNKHHINTYSTYSNDHNYIRGLFFKKLIQLKKSG